MIDFDQAVELLRSVARPLPSETIALTEAAGRILAAPAVARIDAPRSDVSVMDGYAVREADLNRFPASLKLTGASFAGRGWTGSVAPGTCARIFTGAPVPQGADRVVIQENVRVSGDAISIAEHPGQSRHIRSQGSDFAEGDELLAAGRLLDPRAMVAAAAGDLATVDVCRPPRLHILSTGDELAEAGHARDRADAIPDSIWLGVAALAEQWGASTIARTRLADDLPAMERVAGTAIDEADVIVVTGGASVGEKDFAKAMFEPAGLELIFSRVAIKPGKPVWLGHLRKTLVLGLPGNPTSALVTARLLLAPLIAGLTGRPVDSALAWRTMPLASPLSASDARETFHRARLNDGAAEILSFQDSGAQKALADADLLVRQGAHAAGLDAGEQVEVLDF